MHHNPTEVTNSIVDSPYKKIYLWGLLVFIITAVLSAGYYHPDEHFQILEFANYKLGRTPVADLPWEFHERIRPALLPVLGYCIIKALNLFNIYNPFYTVLILRIITALIAWLVISKTSVLLLKEFTTEAGKKIFLLLSFFLWFIPFISVRFSSENYSAITFLSAVYLILLATNNATAKKTQQLAAAGLLLGFSFFFRFQIAFAIIGIGLWLLFLQKLHWKYFFVLILSGLTSAAICMSVDYWYYGQFTFTPYNYFVANIIENKAASWGTNPWWQYFVWFLINAVPPISIVLFIFFLKGIQIKTRHVITWSILLFLLPHFVVGHKEMRFLFPVSFCFIFLAAIAVDAFAQQNRFKKEGSLLFKFCMAVNIPLLLFMMLSPAQPVVGCYNFLHRYASEKPIVLLCKEKTIYNMAGVNVHFYRSPNVNTVIVEDDAALQAYLAKNQLASICLLERDFTSTVRYDGYESKTIYSSLPGWMIHFNVNNWMSRSRIWKIKELRRI